MRPIASSAVVCLCAAALASAPAAAQGVRVSVVDAGTGAPVAGAMVRVEDADGALVRAGFTDAEGAVRLALPDAGRYAVGATRAGYLPRSQTLVIPRSGEQRLVLRLQVRPVALDTVTVVGRRTRELGRQTFERRRATGNGIYLDSAYVAQRRATWPGDLLYSVPGIEVGNDGRSRYRRPYTRMGGRCLVTLVNGLPFYGGWPRWVQLEETLRRSDVVAVEVYRVADEVPAELQRYVWRRGRCGAIVYWTEDGWHSAARGIEPTESGT